MKSTRVLNTPRLKHFWRKIWWTTTTSSTVHNCILFKPWTLCLYIKSCDVCSLYKWNYQLWGHLSQWCSSTSNSRSAHPSSIPSCLLKTAFSLYVPEKSKSTRGCLTSMGILCRTKLRFFIGHLHGASTVLYGSGHGSVSGWWALGNNSQESS